MTGTPEQILSVLEDTALLIKKSQINLKKCPKQRLTKGYIETRMHSIEGYWNTFKNAHQELVKCIPKEQKSSIPYFVNEDYMITEDLYLCLQADLKDLLSSFTSNGHSSIDGHVKLPRILLPTFSGIYEEWPAFQDLFISLVHNNLALSNVQKLHYLKSSLAGKAEALLKHIQVTETNYDQAWNTLKTRYGNRRLIINSLLKKLFTQKKIPAQTANYIKSLLDTTSECINSLQNLKVSTDSWDPIIIFLVVQKLDPESHRDWEQYAYKDESEDLPKWNDLCQFLQTKFRTLELIAPPSRERGSRNNKEYTVHVASEVTTTSPKIRCCTICKENHTLSHCREFTSMEPRNRSEYVKNNNLCYNCLAPGHSAKKCRLNMSCHLCHRRHHTLVYQTKSMTLPSQPYNVRAHHSQVEEQEDPRNIEEPNVAMSAHFSANMTTALLATALVPVRDESGRVTILRALVDNGSQATFISERAAQTLKLKRILVTGTITGIGSSKTTVRHAAEIELLSRHDEKFKLSVKAYIMSTRLTTHLPTKTIPKDTWSHLNGLTLADPEFNQSRRIDMLLGVEVCAQILNGEFIKGPPGSPCAQNTSLGWILFGNISEEKDRNDMIVMHLSLDLDQMLKSMWELDDTKKRAFTAEERQCEQIYANTITRTGEGRYIVKLPTKTENLLSTQGETREIALKKLYQMERRLEKDSRMKMEYVRVMEEYIDMKHMKEIPSNEIDKPSVYLPHHAVVKEEKETTKVRCVFNASEKGKNGVSLNDELLVGPQIQEDMRNLIIRWRMKKVCFVADVQKMYRQILVTKEDQDLQRVVWRSNKNQNVKDYRLLTVTFGTASAPYLAVKTLHQVAEDEGKNHPEASRIIKEEFYMDDLMCGKDNLSEAIRVARDIEAILQRGGFTLQKWCSNDANFLNQFDPSKRSSHVRMNIKIDGTIKALGLQWDMGKDVFQHNLKLLPLPNKVTKRIILAEMQKLFDPLGWVAPSILLGKLLMQKLWLLGITWDEEVDPEIREEWFDLRDSFQYINDIEVKRWLKTTEDNMHNVTIHGFCDASTRAYAAVAVVKPVTLPRLELCGALLLSRLLKQIQEATRIPQSQIFGWTDSTIVLSWLLGDPSRWNTFIRNRVVEIVDNIGHNWYHVPTHENPADTASRGKHPIELKEDEKWWKGPEWLRREEIKPTRLENVVTNLERKEIIHTNLKIENQEENKSLATHFKDFESLTELIKVVAYCKRFLKKKDLKDKITTITTEELEDSLKTCIRLAQRDSFEEEIQALKSNKYIKKESRLKTLHPYIDEKNILRVGGRLRMSDLEEDSKHPIILDNKDELTDLIVRDAHLKTMHGGVQLMLGYLRTKYWILKAKGLVKSRIHKCLTCAKQSAAVRNQIMGELPRVRVTPARPFLHSGVDFAGPYQILMSKGRGVKVHKAYVAIFVCMSTKAIHLELVGDLSSESFIGAFRRFVARRGRCTHLWSDQGRNFVGANNELIRAWNEAKLEFEGPIAQTLALDGTQWHFIPAYSPHMGGLWEAGVKSMKYHMKRIVTTNLTFEEMSTLLCQIEGCLNSRPLSPIEESDTDNIIALTPGHFLIGEAPITIPSPDLSTHKISHLSRWQHMQKLLSDFWKKWQQDYLSRLQQRPKWCKKEKEFEIGHIVLIKNENLPPGKWPLGRIVKKHPGSDGITRVYSIKTGDCIVQRSVVKLCPLPIDIES